MLQHFGSSCLFEYNDESRDCVVVPFGSPLCGCQVRNSAGCWWVYHQPNPSTALRCNLFPHDICTETNFVKPHSHIYTFLREDILYPSFSVLDIYENGMFITFFALDLLSVQSKFVREAPSTSGNSVCNGVNKQRQWRRIPRGNHDRLLRSDGWSWISLVLKLS